MTDIQLDQVTVLLIDPDRGSRDSIRVILQYCGFRAITVGSKFSDMLEATGQPGLDLLICEAEMADGDVCKWIADMRHQRAGCDPFLPVMATTWTPTPQLVRRVVDAGADDLLTKPLSSGLVRGRVQRLMMARKPFVVTSDYIGPDRHHTPGRVNTATLVQVPNALWLRCIGRADMASRDIDAALSTINQQKILHHGDRIVDAMQRLVPMLEAPTDTAVLTRELRDLYTVAEDTSQRMAGTAYDHVSDLCRTLLGIIETISRAPRDVPQHNIELLIPMAQAIQASFAGGGEAEKAAPDMIGSDDGSGPLFDSETAQALAHSDAEKPPAERRHKFLLRLVVGKISHLLSNHTGRRQIIPRVFLKGFDEYLLMLLGRDLYGELNPKARALLDKIESDDDAVIWRTIQEDDAFRAFSFEILVQILLKFSNFARGKRNFMGIVNRVINETLGEVRKHGGRDVFTEGHFNLVFISLFSDVFEALRSAEGRHRLDELLGEGIADELDEIQREYQSEVRRASRAPAA